MMTCSQALDAVGKAYIPGAFDHYAKMNPDPWQEANDKFERALLLKDEQITSIAAQVYVDRILDLIDKFKKQAQPSKDVKPIDAFMMGLGAKDEADAERKTEQWERVKRSLRDKACYRCYAKENLVPVTHPDVPNYTFLACRPCKAKYRLQ